ncbi:MAG: hypothetical protein QM778_15755 [Myxococcales bacterium]
MSVFLWACAGGQTPQLNTAAEASSAQPKSAEEAPAADALSKSAPQTAQSSANNAKTVPAPQGCTPSAGQPKTVSGESSASDSAETGQALIFDVAGIGLEFPACTPETDVRVITVSWDTKDRPNASHIHPNFSRHAATLRVDQTITARDGSPLMVRLHSKRELAKPGEKLVLAVESSGECTDQNKRDKLDDDGCSQWAIYDASFDSQTNEMVARIPATGGYRMQFGWLPNK